MNLKGLVPLVNKEPGGKSRSRTRQCSRRGCGPHIPARKVIGKDCSAPWQSSQVTGVRCAEGRTACTCLTSFTSIL